MTEIVDNSTLESVDAAPVETQQPAQEQEQQQDSNILESSGEQETKIVADWPDDWRNKLAGEDEKLLKRLNRFSGVDQIMKSWLSAEKKITSGEYKKALGDDASEEELELYRKQNNVPEKWEDYNLDLESGMIIGDDDKDSINDFLKYAHENNVSEPLAKKIIEFDLSRREQATAKMAEEDAQDRQLSEDALRADWGNDYRANINLINNMLSNAPEGVKDNLTGARLGDGTLLANNPGVLKYLSELARDINPVNTLVPSGGADSIVSEMDQIQKYMKSNYDDYMKDERMQARYRELLSYKQRTA
jgi:hypothetical protein